MAKVDDYELRRLGQQLIDFKDDLRDILNNGRVQFSVVTAVPAWRANEGEVAFYNIVSPATDRRIYVRLTSAWAVFSFLGGGGGAASNPGGQEGSVQFNSAGAVGPIFGGRAQFVYDATGGGLDLFGHMAIGSDAMVDRQVSQLVSVNTASMVFNINETSFIPNVERMGQWINYHLPSTTVTTGVPMHGLDIYLSTTGGINGNLSQLDGLRTRVFCNGTGNISTLYGNATVLDINYNNVPATGFDHYASYVAMKSYKKANLANSTVKCALRVSDLDDGSSGRARGINYDFQGISIDSFVADANTTSQRAIFNFFSGSQHRDKVCYLESLNQFEGPVVIDGPFSAALATLDIGNTNTQMFIAGSGTLSTSGGSNIITGSGSVFNTEVNAGDVIRLTGVSPRQFFVVVAVTNSTTMYITEVPSVSVDTSAYSIIRPHVRIVPFPSAVDNQAVSPFVICANGYVGIRTVTPSVALEVNGSIKANNVTLGGTLTPAKGSVTFFTTTAVSVSSNNASDTTLITGVIGTTSLVANTLSDGRTIRLQAWGYYNTPTTAGTAIFRVKLSGATILSTSNQTMVSSASTSGWRTEAIITCQTTGGAGTLFAQGRFDTQATAVASSAWFLVGSSPVTFNTTGGAEVEMTFQWGSANAASQLFMSHCIGELLN